MKPSTERERQEQACKGRCTVGTTFATTAQAFSAIAPSEPNAFMVLNAERPGMRCAVYRLHERAYLGLKRNFRAIRKKTGI